MTRKTRNWLILIGICLFFIIGNPGMKQFKEFSKDHFARRKNNFLFFSIYEDNGDRYIGILFNFFRIGDGPRHI